MPGKASKSPSVLFINETHINARRYFEVSLLLMLATAFLTIATTGKLDTLSIVIFSVALGVKLWSYARGESGLHLGPKVVTHLSIAYLFFYAIDLAFIAPGSSLMDRMLSATVHLVLFTTIIKVLSARRYRDYLYLAALSFLMMLASTILTVGTAFVAGLILYVLFAISMFASFEVKRGIDHAPQPPEGPYGNPARNRVALENTLLGASIALATIMVALAAFMFFLIPRFHASYFSALSLDTQNLTGFSETVSLGDIGHIKQSNMVVMRVQIQGGPRRYDGVKWRGEALNKFNGRQWYNENDDRVEVLPAGAGRFILPPPDHWKNRPRRPLLYRIFISNVSTDVLFAAYIPRVVSGRLRTINLDETWSMHAPQRGPSPIDYQVESDAGQPGADELRRTASFYPHDVQAYDLALPGMNPRIAALARQVTSGANNNYDRARAIERYLHRNFRYTLNPESIQPDDPVGSFLFSARQGYCEYFASAMAVMLRSINVPARLVNGFQTGTFNPVGNDFVVRARDAHSWVEVYFASYGWVAFDPTPTPPALPGDVAGGIFSNYLDAMNLFWSEWVINYDFSHQIILAEQVDIGSHQLERTLRSRFEGWKEHGTLIAARQEENVARHPWILLLGLLVMAATWIGSPAAIVARLRFFWAWRFAPPSNPIGRSEAAIVYQTFLRRMQRLGFARLPSQTAAEFARLISVSQHGQPLARLVEEFTLAYQASRFGNQPVPRARLRELLIEFDRTLR